MWVSLINLSYFHLNYQEKRASYFCTDFIRAWQYVGFKLVYFVSAPWVQLVKRTRGTPEQAPFDIMYSFIGYCNLCPHRVFNSQKELMEHTNRKHVDTTCRVCGKEFLSEREVFIHFQSHRKNPGKLFVAYHYDLHYNYFFAIHVRIAWFLLGDIQKGSSLYLLQSSRFCFDSAFAWIGGGNCVCDNCCHSCFSIWDGEWLKMIWMELF